MTVQELEQLFADNGDHYLQSEEIPPSRRRSTRPDLNAFLILDRLVPGEKDIVSSAQHDEISLDVSPEELAKSLPSEGDVIDLIRCGVRLGDEDCFLMFT